jgi:hypothetical protein
MRIIEKPIYTFDELNDKAKERVKQFLMSDHLWGNEYIESLKAFANQFGVQVLNWNYGPWSSAEVKTDATPQHFRGFTLKAARLLPEYPTGYCADYILRDTFINEFVWHFDAFRAFNTAMDAGIKEARADWESQFNDDYVLDHCTANGYEFDEKGNLI